MSTKSDVLKMLEQNIGKTISGEELARSLAVSRTAVWKAIKTLREQGYTITAVTNNGYCLSNETNVLSAEGIAAYLSDENKDIDIIVYKTIDSTNQEAKRLAINGVPHATTIIAIEQTNGKGRLGRQFFSPKESGIYMSMVLRLNADASDAVLITTATSVAVCHAIERVAPEIIAQIKWVNDIYIDNKKVCGILTEAVTNFETGTIESVILGIGINFNTTNEQFPDDIKQRATALFDRETTVKKNRLTAAVIDEVLLQAKNISNRDFLDEYVRRSCVVGKLVRIVTPIEQFDATAVDIDKNGGLIVKCDDGRFKTLNSGDVSIRF